MAASVCPEEAAAMDSKLWLAIAAVTAVTAVILARRKNRSAVIWPMASFLFPLALLPLFALAPLPEKGPGRSDRLYLISVASLLTLIVGIALIRDGSLRPCHMYGYEVAEHLDIGTDPGSRRNYATVYDYLVAPGVRTPEECLIRLFETFLGSRPLP